jgi:transposase
MSRSRKALTSEQVKELQAAQMSSEDAASAKRYQAVRLYGLGYAVETIQEICGCGLPSLWEWNRKYHARGVIGLVDQRQGGNHALLQPVELEALHGWLHAYKPNQILEPDDYSGNGEFWSLAAVACLVAKRFGVRYKSPTSYRNLLAKCDFSYQRTTQQYQSCSPVKVMAFEEELEKNSWT